MSNSVAWLQYSEHVGAKNNGLKWQVLKMKWLMRYNHWGSLDPKTALPLSTTPSKAGGRWLTLGGDQNDGGRVLKTGWSKQQRGVIPQGPERQDGASMFRPKYQGGLTPQGRNNRARLPLPTIYQQGFLPDDKNTVAGLHPQGQNT